MEIFYSYAKLNFFLNITDIYKNSYHKIKSLFTEIDLCDIIEYEKNSLNKIRVFDKNNLLPEDNLLVSASNKFIESIKKIPFGIDFHIEKRIPIGGGLGGGSSNAASVLKILNRVWHINWGNKKLKKISKKIGADVSFFIEGGIQFVSGIGDITRKINTKNKIDIPILLVIPDIKISTIDAYKMIDESFLVSESYSEKKSLKDLISGFKDCNIELIIKNIYNKFEKVIFNKYREFNKIKKDIMDSGAINSFMSGSGSTMVGIYNNHSLLQKGYEFLKNKGYNIYITKIINRK